MTWVDWHDDYDKPGSLLQRRLITVQRRIRQALDTMPPGPIRVLSMCAGQGRDLLGVLADHPRSHDVHARLVELNPQNVARATENAPPGVEVVIADAALTNAYESVTPVDLALVCGVFGQINEPDIQRTIAELPHLCAANATVIWTRHIEPPDRTPAIRAWFTEHGFEELGFDTETGFSFSVGTHRLTGPTQPFRRDMHLFTFSRHPGR
jgi:hypothetical protein